MPEAAERLVCHRGAYPHLITTARGCAHISHRSSLIAHRSSLIACRLSLLARQLLTKKFYSRGPEGPEKESLRGRGCRGEVTE